MRRIMIAGAAVAPLFALQACDVEAAPQADCAEYAINHQAVQKFAPGGYPEGNIDVTYVEADGGIGFGRRVTGLVTEENDGEYTLFVPDLPTDSLADIMDPSSGKSIVLGIESPAIGVLGLTNGCIGSEVTNQAGVTGTEVILPLGSS